MLKSNTPQGKLEEMARIAETNRRLVAKAFGKKHEEKVNPYVQYAHATKK